MSKRSSILLAAAFLMIGIVGCGSDKPTAPVVDTVAPAAVVDLAAEVVTGSGVELTWAPGTEPDLAAYRVYRSTNGGASVLVSNETASTFRDGTVQPGTTYVYEVSAVDTSNNESPRVATATITVPDGTGTGRGQESNEP